ncbi:MAG: gamma-glutamylcyclotransferase [Kiloniellaceae bacterium]
MTKPSSSADIRLVAYGTLAPGRANHHQLVQLRGLWRQGTVRGRLIEAGWGAAMGFPGLVLDPRGDDVAVHLLESDDLPHHWARLDAFEGVGYRRTVTEVQTEDALLEAWVYVIAR